jgi:hypothetical protein
VRRHTTFDILRKLLLVVGLFLTDETEFRAIVITEIYRGEWKTEVSETLGRT